MLILERKPGASIILQLPGGEVVRLLVMPSSNPRQARIGIDAPPHVAVDRLEVALAKAKLREKQDDLA